MKFINQDQKDLGWNLQKHTLEQGESRYESSETKVSITITKGGISEQGRLTEDSNQQKGCSRVPVIIFWTKAVYTYFAIHILPISSIHQLQI